MKVDFSQQLYDLDGGPLNVAGQPMKPGDRPMTLGVAATTALQVSEPNPTGDEKERRLLLAVQIRWGKSSVLDLPVEDVALIKRLIDGWYMPLIVGQTRALLEGEQNPIQGSAG